MENKIQLIGSLFVLFGVVLGALASHALKDVLEPSAISSFEVGVRYMLYHGLALLILSFLKYPKPIFQKAVFYLIALGVLLFSGSIFLLSFKTILPFNVRFLGPVTPIGGTLLISAWLVNIYALIKIKNTKKTED